MAITLLGTTITSATQVNAITLPRDARSVIVQQIWDGTTNPIRNLWIYRSWEIPSFGIVNEASLLYKVARNGKGLIQLVPIAAMDYQSAIIRLLFLQKRGKYETDDYPYLVEIWYPN